MESSHSSSQVGTHVPEIEWNWAEAEYNPAWHEPIIEVVSKYIPEGVKVLEVGAGGSHTLGAVAGRLGCRAVGIEPDKEGVMKTIDLATKESARVSMARGDGFCLPFSDGEFDVVYSLGLVEHFNIDETRALIDEHVRVCRKGGTVIVSVPNLLNLPHSLRKAYLGPKYPYFPEHSFTPSRLREMLSSSGLRSIELDGILPLWGLGMSATGWLMVRALRRIGVAKILDGVRNQNLRGYMGYMTYAIGRK